jgi:pimeloyl-ACP methyl ester carboxylesterase
MNIVFCHGAMGPKYDWNKRTYDPAGWWADWLQFMVELEHDVIMQRPYFPHAHALLMKYDEWEQIMNKQDINEDTVLIGHSAGGGFVLKYLSKHPELKVHQVILVAPWIDAEDFQPFGFYKDFKLNNDIVAQSKQGIDLMFSDDDMPHIQSSFDKIIKNIPDIRVHKFSGRGHFTGDELPEIMPIIKW